ncbi:L,D-transpeptidase [Synoicihabitans lomoniglobus]|uniref:L,D-transpeptidase n=1 Tax=Synoicihabitans lomoniglobus TaxID=2909285 RepID=A0AAF0CRJ5_9BACT|nr:L,D-transpeptidase [Opitutaceae bacterium LMO-M01]WED66773.1 L,D-transpeptidase [Opitutaceae bacterium LMO-M01]
MKTPWELVMQSADALGIKPAERLLHVSITDQTLQLFQGGTLVRTFEISTSSRPPSNQRDSLGTPRGLHTIAERIGAGQPPGMVFRSRVATGHHFSELNAEENERNLVTTRILWLRGLEKGYNAGGNVDSYDRYIYIHGTNHEDRIGRPASGGCVQLRNLEMVELYDAVRAGDWVNIVN